MANVSMLVEKEI